MKTKAKRGGTFARSARYRKGLEITLSPAAHKRLEALAAKIDESKSIVVERLIYAAKLAEIAVSKSIATEKGRAS